MNVDLKITNPQKHIPITPELSARNSVDKTKLAEASRQFESLLTSMMIKSMNETTGGMFGEEGGMGGDYFDSIFQYEIASKFSEGKGLGVADMIYSKITGEHLPVQFNQPRLEPLQKMDKINFDSDSLPGTIVHPSNESLDRLEKFDEIINNASETFGINKNIIKSVILAESSAKENALSSANAKGLMQLMDSTAKDLGVSNPWNPKQNIMGGTKYLSQLLRQYDGDLKLALAAYNAGPGNVDKHGGIPPFQETQNYVTRVLGYLKNFEG